MIPLTKDSQLAFKNNNYYKLESDGQLRIMANPTTIVSQFITDLSLINTIKDTETVHHTICTTNSREYTFTLDLIKVTCARDTRQILHNHNALSKEYFPLMILHNSQSFARHTKFHFIKLDPFSSSI